jgi:hypothetical protein
MYRACTEEVHRFLWHKFPILFDRCEYSFKKPWFVRTNTVIMVNSTTKLSHILFRINFCLYLSLLVIVQLLKELLGKQFEHQKTSFDFTMYSRSIGLVSFNYIIPIRIYEISLWSLDVSHWLLYFIYSININIDHICSTIQYIQKRISSNDPTFKRVKVRDVITMCKKLI